MRTSRSTESGFPERAERKAPMKRQVSMEPEKQNKLLFFDIDGTLIDDDHQIPDSVIPALIKARENGCLLFLNTGRTLCNMDPRLREIPLDGRITGCGSRVVFRDKTLKAVEYPLKDSLIIREAVLNSRIPVVYECDTGMYFDPEGVSWPDIERFRRFSDRAGLTRFVTEEDPEFRAVKMFAFSDGAEPIRKMLQRLERVGYPFEAIDRGGTGWEIVPAGCSKADGIDIIRKETGVSLSACYAFGDSNNDRAMLEHVPNSIAMGNAPEELKQICRYVTSRPEEGGIAEALKKLGLI